VIGWTADLHPLGPDAARRDLLRTWGGDALLDDPAAAAYLERPDVLAQVDVAAHDAGERACYGIGGHVVGWKDGLPVCDASKTVLIPRTTPRGDLQPPAGAPIAWTPARASELVAWGTVTCDDDLGRALVGWSIIQGGIRPLCGGGTGHIDVWVPAASDRLVAACAADVDRDGEIELAVATGSIDDSRVDVLDGDRVWALDQATGSDAAASLACGSGWIGAERFEGTASWRYSGDGFERTELPG
jgi:hypothetical protein